ncbi:MAG: hypothetical protein Q8K26_02010 [Candidatus Gracilibacteria bacterium]|nr:hypothetical protein [Candidatus Gracilibacteria bacterium]
MNNQSSLPQAFALGFCLAVTGHRAERISEEAGVSLLRAVVELLRFLDKEISAAQELASGYYVSGGPELKVVSALAEGADRIIAWAGLRQGWRLDVVLPFPPLEYELDFPSSESRKEFTQLLEAASAVMDLGYSRETEVSQGYIAVGQVLARNCDLLVAIWDGEPAVGPGGTAQVVEAALKEGVPVVWMLPEATPRVRLIVPTSTGPLVSDSGDWRDALKRLLHEALSPPQANVELTVDAAKRLGIAIYHAEPL